MKKLFGLVLSLFICVSSFDFTAGALCEGAAAAIIINADTGEVIFEKNSEKQLPMASTTKIMTALLLCESDNLDETLTVTQQMVQVEGSSMGLLAGDTVSKRDLLYGMMLASGNDAANVTAYLLGGTVDGFVKLMNQKAEKLGLKNTHFDTPSGLDGDTHYTTAHDLALLTKYALKNEEFAKAAASVSATLCYGNPPYKRTLTNHNKLLKKYDGCIGVKTGFTKKAGRCLVSAARKDGKTVIAITLNCPNDWNCHQEMLDFGLNSIELIEIAPEKRQYTLAVIGGKEEKIKVEIPTLKIGKTADGSFNATVNLPRFLYAPVNKGEEIGSVVYTRNGEVIAEEKLYAHKGIERKEEKASFFKRLLNNIKYIFKSIWEI